MPALHSGTRTIPKEQMLAEARAFHQFVSLPNREEGAVAEADAWRESERSLLQRWRLRSGEGRGMMRHHLPARPGSLPG